MGKLLVNLLFKLSWEKNLYKPDIFGMYNRQNKHKPVENIHLTVTLWNFIKNIHK